VIEGVRDFARRPSGGDATLPGYESKSPDETGLCNLDGLVSTGKEFPTTILKTFFSLRKKTSKYFINIASIRCGLSEVIMHRMHPFAMIPQARLFDRQCDAEAFSCNKDERRRDGESFIFVDINSST
jgi:hypothetical protein